MLVALAVRTDDWCMVHLQAGTHRFKRFGDVGPTAIRDDRLGAAIPQTRGVQNHQRDPTRFRRGNGASQHGARVAVEDDQAPPFDPVNGKVHFPPVNEPILVGSCSFVGVRPRGLGAVWFAHMWDIVIDLLVEHHHASHGPLGNVRSGEQTPDAEAARIGMALLQMIHVDHERQPGFTRRRFGRTTLVLQPSQVLRFKAPYPPIDRRPGDVQKPADTALTPALTNDPSPCCILSAALLLL